MATNREIYKREDYKRDVDELQREEEERPLRLRVSKATLYRKVMFAVLRHYGIPATIVNAISVLYNNSKSAVMVDGNISAPFQVTTGVLQGDVLAPFLFIVLIDFLMKSSTEDTDSGIVTHPRQSRRHPAKILSDLDFADDIALLESCIPKAQAQLSRTAAAGKQLGLIISAPKTEYMTFNCNSQPQLEVYGQPIKHVSNFRGSREKSRPSESCSERSRSSEKSRSSERSRSRERCRSSEMSRVSERSRSSEKSRSSERSRSRERSRSSKSCRSSERSRSSENCRSRDRSRSSESCWTSERSRSDAMLMKTKL